MDLSELIKSYTPEQKNVFTAFCINWPLAFTVMFVYSSSFRGHEFYLQLIFSVSATIIAELAIFFTMIVSAIFANVLGTTNIRIRKFMWLPCLVCPGIFFAMAMLYSAGKDSVLAKPLFLESIFTFAAIFTGMTSFSVFEFVKNSIRKEKSEDSNIKKRECSRNVFGDRLIISSDKYYSYQDCNIKYIYKEN